MLEGDTKQMDNKQQNNSTGRIPVPITQFGDPVLRLRAREVDLGELDSPEIQGVIEDMIASLAAAGGAGLAAPQISVSKRIVIIKYPAMNRVGYGEIEEMPLLVLINPEIVYASEETRRAPEACLSINTADGGRYEGVLERPERVQVRAYDRTGKEFTVDAGQFLSRALQHEVDHLEGILFTDRIRDLKDLRIVRPVEVGDPVLQGNVHLSQVPVAL
jgi:peptide deformylase